MATATSAVQVNIGGKVSPGLLGGLTQLNKGMVGMAGALKGLTAGFVAFGALNIAGRFLSFTSEAIKTADQMGKLAQKTGIASEALGQLAFAAKQNDVELGALQTGLKGLSEWMVKNGRAGEPLEKVLLDVADSLVALSDAEKVVEAREIFGRAGIDLLPLLLEGSTGIKRLTEDAANLGVVTDAQAKAADAWGDSVGRLNLVLENLARTVSQKTLVSITALNNAMANNVSQTAVWTKYLAEWVLSQTLIGRASNILNQRAASEVAKQQREALKQQLEDHVTLVQRLRDEGNLTDELAQGFFEVGKKIRTGMQSGRHSIEQTTNKLEQQQKLLEEKRRKPIDFAAEQEAAAKAFRSTRANLELTREETRLAADEQAVNLSEQEAAVVRMAQLETERLQLAGLMALTEKAALSGAITKQEELTLELRDRRELLQVEQQIAAVNREQFEDTKRIAEAKRRESESTFGGAADARYQEFLRQGQIEREQGLSGAGPGALAGVKNVLVDIGHTSEIVGRSITTTLGGAINALSEGIEGLILGTLTWKEALQQVGQAILQSVVTAIAQMIAQMIVSYALQLIFGKAMQREAQQVGASWHAAAISASIATYGTAAGVGLAAFLAAQAAGATAAAGFSSGFAMGGYTGDGPAGAPAGIVHRGEFVMPATTVQRVGVPALESIRAGSNAGGVPVNLAIFDDRTGLETWMRSQGGRAAVMDVVRRNRHEFA